jgi:hypothetical protein
VTLYVAARRWITDNRDLPNAQQLDRHQLWSVVDQSYPGGWTAFTTNHQERP